MKVHSNENLTKSSKDITKNNLHKKSFISYQNNPIIPSSIFKANKTIQKYISERLNSIEKIKNNTTNNLALKQKNHSKLNFKNHPYLIKRKLIISPNHKNSNKNIGILKKQKNIKEKKSKEKKKY